MKRKDWNKKLKKRLSRLPREERDRILSYYGEMFDDKAESGMSEEEILREFGAPADVAARFLSEYAEPAAKKTGVSAGRIAAGVCFQVLAGVALVCVIISLIAACVSLAVSFTGVSLAGAGCMGFYIVQHIRHGFATVLIAYYGLSAAAIGLGLVLAPLFFKLTPLSCKLLVKYFQWSAAMFTGSKAVKK